MKKIILTLFIAVLGVLLVSCTRDITEPTISSSPTKSTLADLSLSAAFTVNNADSLIRFSWAASDFGFPASISYTVQLSPSSTFASNVATLFTTQALKGTYKVGDANTLLLAWNFAIGTPATVYYRVVTTLAGSTVAPLYSDSKSKSLTPYDAVINYPMIYVPGAYQGWSPGATNGILYSYGFNSVYQGIIRIIDGTNAASDFKIAPAANWNNSWGGTLTKTGNNYAGSLNPTGGNFTVNAGCYAITVDVNALTISLTKTDDWGLIGDAVPVTGWNSDVNMFYNGQRKMWEITTNLVAGSIKFRANDDWTLNYGDNGADGSLESGGANIAIASAGNYLIRFDPVKLTYTVKKN